MMVEGDADGLRQRSIARSRPRSKARKTHEAVPLVAERTKQVYGRTPDGTVFALPRTESVIAGLFDPRLPKSALDVVTLLLLASQVVLWFSLPLETSRWLFICIFAFWRLAYNAGLGWLLTQQSKRKWIVTLFKRKGWLDKERHPHIQSWIARQVSVKFSESYDFEAYPPEWNVWVLFRHSVDVILLNDFLAYAFFGISFISAPNWTDSKAVVMCLTRWAAGITLILFNLWVKTDAHRIITDLAWYWADTFFQSLQDLVFDGVFEMAPHPMYSVGYAGYYGLSLISGSETVLFVSLAAHACQFAFLVFFENPHIERTYGQRKPLAMRRALSGRRGSTTPSEQHEPLSDLMKERQHSTSSKDSRPASLLDTPTVTDHEDICDSDTDIAVHSTGHTRRQSSASTVSMDSITAEIDRDTPVPVASRLHSTRPSISVHDRPLRSQHDVESHYFRHDTILFSNFDWLRASDVGFALGIVYMSAGWLSTYLTLQQQIVAFFLNALAWRFIHTFVLGTVLKKQSEKKWMVRHYLKHYYYDGSSFEAVNEAFSNWKSIYNISLCMVYTSFGLLALRCYDWTLFSERLRHTLGAMLIALHIWTAKAIFDVIGKFGWFYGDFFVRNDAVPLQLYYTGIYRHVNNPERIMGGAAFFGLALISGSKLVGAMAVVSVLSHFWFLSCVENPHMQRLYGKAMRKDAGVTKTFKGVASKSSQRAPPQLQKVVQDFQGTLEKVLDETSTAVEDFLRRSAPRLNGYVENTKVLLREQGEKLMITRVTDVGDVDQRKYAVTLVPSNEDGQDDNTSLPDLPARSRLPNYQLGETITIKWQAPSNCSRRDWIGLYRLGANKSTAITQVRSQGRWLGIYPDEWEGDQSISLEGQSTSDVSGKASKRGLLTFSDKRIFWKPGQYEFRYHHDGMHNVLAVSEPFEIVVSRPRDLSRFAPVYDQLLPLVTRCLNSDPLLVPETALELLPMAHKPSSQELTKIHAERADTDDFVIFDAGQATRIAEAVHLACGLELTSQVIIAEPNVAKLARSVVEAWAVLQPFEPGGIS